MNAEKKITDKTEVSTTELAAVLGVTARRVQQMAQDGTLPTEKRGVFLLGDSVQRYIRFVSAQVDEDERKAEKAKRIAEAQIKASKATIAKLEAEELKGIMHRAEDVAAITEELVYTIRAALTALPGRVAVDVTQASSPMEASAIIRAETNRVMRELANFHYDPKKYEERIRGRNKWTDQTDDE